MKRTFLILGLRARTAWLSTLFSVGPVYCHHDLCYHQRGATGAAAAMWATPAEVVGNADSGNALHLDALCAELEHPAILIVRRARSQVHQSFCRVTHLTEESTAKTMAEYEALLEQLQQRPGVLAVDYEDLDEEEVMRVVWEHCVGAAHPFPEHHWRKVRTMRVEIHPELMRRVAAGEEIR